MDDFILAADAVLTMDASNRVIPHGALRISNGRILTVAPLAAMAAAYPEWPVEHWPNTVLMPGLINTHLHSGMLRGTAEHLPVWDWLTRHINPMHRVLSPAEAEAASWLAYAESILGGTTTIVDMWRFMEGSARAAAALGNRLVATPYVGEHPDYDYFDRLDMNERLLQTWHRQAEGRINIWVGLEHLFYADAAGQQRAIALARAHDTGLHTHCSEAEIEIAEFDRLYGARPMVALEKLGFFTVKRCLIAHAVWLDADEIALIAQHPVAVAHNPASNMKLASGIAPIAEMLAAGIPVGLGTDGEKENNNFDMFEEMKLASLLGKLRHRDAAAMESWQALRMATILGARAIGLDAEIGSLEPGKRADIIGIRTDTPRMTPCFLEGPYFNLQHNLVHAVRGGDVCLTMVDGKVLASHGVLQTGDLAAIIRDVARLAPGLFARHAAWLAQNNTANVQWTEAVPP